MGKKQNKKNKPAECGLRQKLEKFLSNL